MIDTSLRLSSQGLLWVVDTRVMDLALVRTKCISRLIRIKTDSEMEMGAALAEAPGALGDPPLGRRQ